RRCWVDPPTGSARGSASVSWASITAITSRQRPPSSCVVYRHGFHLPWRFIRTMAVAPGAQADSNGINKVSITECPRDAMQGMHRFIPTATKAAYIKLLLDVGFDRLDFGSFVSPKAIPQMRDTAAVLDLLNSVLAEKASRTGLLAIVANVRGAEEAVQHAPVEILGFAFSVSETFQRRNANSSVAQALDTVKQIVTICRANNRTPLVYLSMGFGNPYGDPWSATIVAEYTEKLVALGVRHFALADTVGSSTP